MSDYCSCLSCGCRLYHGLKVERDLLRIRAERAEAEVERLRAERSLEADELRVKLRLCRERRSSLITDEVVDRALAAFWEQKDKDKEPPAYWKGMRAALEAVWPT